MKKFYSILLIVAMIFSLVACGGGSSQSDSVELTVVTPFNEKDGNRKNFVEAYTAFEEDTGIKINDVETKVVDEQWKMKVLEDFRDGNDPDVIYFFTGADANELIKNDKIVSISDIRAEFPDYASNMKESLMPVSLFDGRQYAVPVNGYWEGLFVNKQVLADCGVDIPGTEYTWDQFLVDCQTIKDNGYTPIACSLMQIPHYWFEYTIFNNGTVASHPKLPEEAGDEIGQNWINGLNDIKTLYEKGFFPSNTNEVGDDDTAMTILENKSAFLLDGSWKVGWFQDNSEKLGIDVNNFAVTYVPAKNNRKATDSIGGFSMGYYISQSAWNDPEKREACVKFVTAMTTDEVASAFGELTVTALSNGVIQTGEELDMLAQSTIEMTKGCTAIVPAVQDSLSPESRDNLFKNIPNIVIDKVTAEDAIKESLKIFANS